MWIWVSKDWQKKRENRGEIKELSSCLLKSSPDCSITSKIVEDPEKNAMRIQYATCSSAIIKLKILESIMQLSSAGDTNEARSTAMEHTFIMIKPDGVQRGLVGEIISRFEKKGFYLKGLKLVSVERSFAEKHYADLSAKPFFGSLVEYIISGPGPTFDIKLSQPIIFSTFETEENPLNNALLSDICISTSAAPTYLPGHYFETRDDQGTTRSFNLIDGGVAANNPTISAMSQVTKQILKSNTDFESYEPVDYSRFLVVSIGTGTPKQEENYSAQMSARWGLLGWLYNGGNTPLIDVFSHASSDMVDIYIAHVFRAHDSEGRYLRIQDDTLTGDAASVDKSTEKNLQNLVEIGKKLLEKPVSRVNLETGMSEPVVDGKGGTTSNADQLVKVAKKLSGERKRRQASLASVA